MYLCTVCVWEGDGLQGLNEWMCYGVRGRAGTWQHVLSLTSLLSLTEESQVWDNPHCAEEMGRDQLSSVVTVRATGLHSPGTSSAATPLPVLGVNVHRSSAVGSYATVTLQCRQEERNSEPRCIPMSTALGTAGHQEPC